jgi:hypothetical protein
MPIAFGIMPISVLRQNAGDVIRECFVEDA